MVDWIGKAAPGVVNFPRFAFAGGGSLDLRQGYHTLGKLDPDGGNAVLMLHGTTGTGKQFLQPSLADPLFAPGAPLDVAKHFIVLPDAIGHGASSRPSDGLGPDFPRYGYADIVEAQYRLVVEGLGLKRLRLVLGTSMGGMQTWMWGQRYPDFMDALMPVASLPERVAGRNLLWRRMLIQLIRSDPAYAGGRYRNQPPGLGRAMSLFKLMVDSPAHLAASLDTLPAADSRVVENEREAIASEDANDVVFEFDASYDYDPAPFLDRIAAPLLAVNFADDELNPVSLGCLRRSIACVRRGRAVTLPIGPYSIGHQTLRVAEVWSGCLAELLFESRPPP